MATHERYRHILYLMQCRRHAELSHKLVLARMELVAAQVQERERFVTLSFGGSTVELVVLWGLQEL